MGYISSISNKGCFIQVAPNLTVRASLSDLHESYVKAPFTTYPLNSLVLFRITSISEPKSTKNPNKPQNQSKFYNANLKASIIKYKTSITLKNLKPQEKYSGKITSLTPKPEIQILSSPLTAFLKKSSEPLTLTSGSEITAQILSIDKSHTPPKIKCRITNTSSEEEATELQRLERLFNKINTLREQEILISKTTDKEQQETEKGKESKEGIKEEGELKKGLNRRKGEFNEEGEEKAPEIEMQSDDDSGEESDEDVEMEEHGEERIKQSFYYDSDEPNQQKSVKEKKTKSESIDMDTEMKEEEKDSESEIEMSDDTGSSVSEQEYDLKQQQSQQTYPLPLSATVQSQESKEKKESKSGKAKLKQKLQEENKIRETEKELQLLAQQPTQQIQSEDHFERLLLANKQNDYLWIQYAAFLLKKNQIQQSRFVICLFFLLSFFF
jgi:hypothetical protein